MSLLAESLQRKVKRRLPGGLSPTVTAALNPRITLRNYQQEALLASEIVFYDPDELLEDESAIAFHLATGAGKTVVLAANMVQLAARGYQRFIFLVNTTNLIEKTRSVLCDPRHPKYLFNPDGFLIGGAPCRIEEVSQFPEDPAPGTLYVLFTTIQQLHLDITAPREGRPAEDNLTSDRTVFLVDEAHHVNAATRKKGGQQELGIEATWEGTVERLFHQAPDAWLLEYSATLDVDPAMTEKYSRRTIARYTLREFREDGWAKDVLLLKAGGEDVERALLACVLSEYRRHVAADAGLACKPVVMFKHTSIKALEAFSDELHGRLERLTGAELSELAERHGAASPLREAFADLCGDVAAGDRLADQLRVSFQPANCWVGHSDKTVTPEEIALVNSLEAAANPIRAVFVVAQLTEGWDVLNLFDIVRLGEVAKGKASLRKACVADAQLIGRGARYWPFAKEGLPADRRAFDKDLTNPLRLLEQVHYHSVADNHLIAELREALRGAGLLPEKSMEVDVRVKSRFRSTKAFLSGVIFQNELDHTPHRAPTVEALGLPNLRANLRLDGAVEVATEGTLSTTDTHDEELAFQLLDRSLLRTAARRSGLTYDIVAAATDAPGLAQFLFDDDWLGATKVKVTLSGGTLDGLQPPQILAVVTSAMSTIVTHLRNSAMRARGTRTFKPVPLRDAVVDKKMRLRQPDQRSGTGVPMSTEDDRLRLNLAENDWYVHDDNHGTDQEKLLIRWFSDNRERLFGDRFSEHYLLRNAGYFALYDFDTGRRCEPDFLILLVDRATTIGGVQVFVESKGPHLTETDAWKQAFLTRIAADVELLANEKTWRLHGLPFFTEDDTMPEALDQFEAAAKEVA